VTSKRLLQHEIEQLVVQANASASNCLNSSKAVEAHWSRLEKGTEVKRNMIQVEKSLEEVPSARSPAGLELQRSRRQALMR
jgi:hypothetical protein